MELLWEDITEEELKRLYYDENLSDGQIADSFGVTKSKVAYKRNKFGISFRSKVYKKFIEQNSELFDRLNANAKERLLKRENIDALSKAITHFAFRNGPIEDMHGNGQFSQNDMKTLNKYMVNRMAGLLTAIADNNWLQLELLFAYYSRFATQWDPAEPDMKEFDLVLHNAIEHGA